MGRKRRRPIPPRVFAALVEPLRRCCVTVPLADELSL